MTFASIIVPAFNVEATLTRTLNALLAQTYTAYEIIIVDDGSTDRTAAIAAQFGQTPKVRVIHQTNRGLAGARNTGINAARGEVIGFCDADDLWVPEKLARHIAHLEANAHVGVSYSGSALIDDAGQPLGQAQRPKLRHVSMVDIFKRNPIGNGSAVVMRRVVLNAIAYRPAHEVRRNWYFDETFRQSEDIECWMRIALETDWVFEGIGGLLTQYRISAGGLSAATGRQLAAWDRMVAKLRPQNEAFFAVNTPVARAYQLRYLSRRAINDLDGTRARQLMGAWLSESRWPLFEEPVKSTTTLLATLALCAVGPETLQRAVQKLRQLRGCGGY